jgi:hypothetical protein
MRIKLYHVVPELGEQLYVAATDTHQVAGIFAGFSFAAGWGLGAFAVERVDNDIPDELQVGLDAMLEFGLEGIAVFERPLGWRVIPPG